MSIIVPIFKVREDYLEECMRSIVNQSFTDFEVILVDDGGPREVGVLCDTYARMDARIRVIHQDNQGVSVARNNGLADAKADWIMFVDADDWLEEDACERLKQHLDGNNWDILLFSCIKEYANNHVLMNYGLQHGQTYKTANVEERELLYRRAMRPPTLSRVKAWPLYYSWNKVYRREFLLKNDIRYPDGISKSEDKIFALRCFEKLSTLHCVGDALYHYRINADSVCNSYLENVDTDRLKLVKELEEIARRMDRELGALKNDAEYCILTEDYRRFVFGIISDVLLLKYYHPDCPYDKQTQKREAIAFLEMEPFKSVLISTTYKSLTTEGKVKKWMLKRNLLRPFSMMKHLQARMANCTPSR